MGGKRWHPTDAQRRLVEQLKSFGLRDEEVAEILGTSEKTLKRHCAHELHTGLIKANARVAQRAFEMAIRGDPPAATFFWLKTRAGWRETERREVVGEDGGPISLKVIYDDGDGDSH